MNNFNNINLNKVNINNNINILKIIKNINIKNFKEELKFINILKNKVIKRTKAFIYTNNNFKNNNKVFILNLRVFKYYMLYKDILLNYKSINNKSIIIAVEFLRISIKVSYIINKSNYLNIREVK